MKVGGLRKKGGAVAGFTLLDDACALLVPVIYGQGALGRGGGVTIAINRSEVRW